MAYTCIELNDDNVIHLEETGVLDEFYLSSEQYLDGKKNFNYSHCNITTEEFNNLTQEQKKSFWKRFLRCIGNVNVKNADHNFKSLAMQEDGYILHLYNGYINGNIWVEERCLSRPDKNNSRAYTFTNDFWTPKYTYLKSLGITKMTRIVETDGALATLLSNPDVYSYNTHLDNSTLVVEDVVTSYDWADVTHKHITIDLT